MADPTLQEPEKVQELLNALPEAVQADDLRKQVHDPADDELPAEQVYNRASVLSMFRTAVKALKACVAPILTFLPPGQTPLEVLDNETETQFTTHPDEKKKNRTTGYNKTCQGVLVFRSLIAILLGVNSNYWYMDGVRCFQSVEADRIPKDALDKVLLGSGIPYLLFHGVEDLGKLVGHGCGRKLLADVVQDSTDTLRFIYEGPARGNRWSLVIVPAEVNLSQDVLDRQAHVGDKWYYPKPTNTPAIRDRCRLFPSPLDLALLQISRTGITRLSNPTLLSTLSPDVQAAVSVSPTPVPDDQLPTFSHHFVKHSLELPTLVDLSEAKLSESINKPFSTAARVLVDGQKRTFVALCCIFDEEFDGDAIIKRFLPNLPSSISPSKDLSKNENGGGVDYLNLPMGSHYQSKDGAFALELVVLAARAKAQGGIMVLYDVGKDLEGRDEICGISFYLTTSDEVTPLGDRITVLRAISAITSLRACFELRSDLSDRDRSLLAKTTSYRKKLPTWDPETSLDLHPNIVACLDSHYQFLFFSTPRQQVISRLSHFDTKTTSCLSKGEATYIVGQIEKRHESTRARDIAEYSIQDSAGQATASVREHQAQVAAEHAHSHATTAAEGVELEEGFEGPLSDP